MAFKKRHNVVMVNGRVIAGGSNVTIVNGRVIEGNNITVIDGHVIERNEKGEKKKIDEVKRVDRGEVECIAINSAVNDVNLISSDSSMIEVHFYGEAYMDGNIDFDVQLQNRELKIKAIFNGCCWNGELKLDVVLPMKTFDTISIQSKSADIKLSEYVLTKTLDVETLSGDIEGSATFSEAFITTMSGDVDISAFAEKDIFLKINTMSGDVSTKFKYIKKINLYTHSVSGDVRNRFEGKGEFTASVNISTVSGDIMIR